MFAAHNMLATQGAAYQLTTNTYSQSGVYSGTSAATWSVMNNNSASGSGGQTATSGSSPSFIKTDCGSSMSIQKIVIGYDYLSNLGPGFGTSFTESASVEGSDNDSTWTHIATTPTYSSSGSSNGLVEITIGQSWRYIRLVAPMAEPMVLTEFQVWVK